MLAICYYEITAKQSLLECPDLSREFAEFLIQEGVLIESREGGRSAWSSDDHLAKVKLLFLIHLKGDYDEPFIQNAQLSIEFFEQWFNIRTFDTVLRQEEVLDNLDVKMTSQLVPTGHELVDALIGQVGQRQQHCDFPRTEQYRIWWQGDVIGWLKEPKLEFPNLHGKWHPTSNSKGKEFSTVVRNGLRYSVVVEGNHYLEGELEKNEHGATICLRLA